MRLRGGYFHSVGYTEIGGLNAFLKKLNPEVEWVRCFPGKNVFSRPRPIPSNERTPTIRGTAATDEGGIEGLTGVRLQQRMLLELARHWQGSRCTLDFVLLVDDADCRFMCADDPAEAYRDWVAELTKSVRAETGKQALGFHALLAFPEIESWLLADWHRGFGATYRVIDGPLHQHIKNCILSPLPWPQLEDFGGRLVNGSCEHKLSGRIQAAFVDGTGCGCASPLLSEVARQPGAPLRYSKNIDGAAMLKRIEPADVARFSPRFNAAWQPLRVLKPRDPSAQLPRA